MTEDLFKDFKEMRYPIDFEWKKVYVICIKKHGKNIPIYVGETRRMFERIRDYFDPSFDAQTDFKIGIALKHILDKGYEISILHKTSESRKAEEKKILTKLKANGYVLLNDLKGYDYKTANENNEREKICRFVDERILRFVLE